jgi:hypothetical protein
MHAVPAAALGRALLAFLLQVHELLQMVMTGMTNYSVKKNSSTSAI